MFCICTYLCFKWSISPCCCFNNIHTLATSRPWQRVAMDPSGPRKDQVMKSASKPMDFPLRSTFNNCLYLGISVFVYCRHAYGIQWHRICDNNAYTSYMFSVCLPNNILKKLYRSRMAETTWNNEFGSTWMILEHGLK